MKDQQDNPQEPNEDADIWGDRIAISGFLASLMLLAFGYGVATMKWQIFPHGVIMQAGAAWSALTEVQDAAAPPHFIRYEDDTVTIAPSESFASDPGDLIIMTGGFFYRPDICPEIGCMAWIMDRSGQVYHSWAFDPDELFTEEDFADYNGFTTARNIYVQGTDVDRDGNLIVTFQGRNVFPYHVGVAKFSPSGDLLWKRIDQSHHWPTVAATGAIYLPVARIEPPESKLVGMQQRPRCSNGSVYEEGLRILNPDGTDLATFWFEDVVRQSDLRALAYTVRDDCDPYHINGIDLVNEAGAEQLRAQGVTDAKVGDMIASLRSSSSFVIMDRDSGQIKHILYGPMVAPHSPATLPDGSVLAFDNLGGHDPEGASRIVQFSLRDRSHKTTFPQPGQSGQDFRSDAEGAVNVSADGTRMLVAETLNGRVFEVDIETGKVLWIYHETGSVDAYHERVGKKKDTRLARHQTQGAAYISRADAERLFGPLN